MCKNGLFSKFCILILSIVTAVLFSSCKKEKIINGEVIEPSFKVEKLMDPRFGYISSKDEYKKDELATIEIFLNNGYLLEGVYFRYSGSTYDLPKSERNMLKSKILHIKIRGNIEVIPVVKEASIENEFKRVSLVDDRYWKEQNQKAYNEIFPKIKTVSDEEAFNLIHMNYPALSEVLVSHTLYTNEVNYFSQTLWNYNWRDENGDALLETEDEQKAYRIAFGLANEGGEIVEIYPPVYWGLSPQNFTVPCFVTVPEGQYQQKLFVNVPTMRECWIDMPLTAVISDESKNEKNPWGYPLFHQLNVSKESWYDASWTKKTVVDRTSKERSAPVWHDLRIYQDNSEILPVPISENFILGYEKDYELEFFLSEYSNQIKKGEIFVKQENRIYIEPNNSLANMIEDHYMLHEKGERMKPYSFLIGKADVISGSGRPQKVKIRLSKTFGDYGGFFHNPGLIFYWKENGMKDMIQINGSGHVIMNRVQKSNMIPSDQWWNWHRRFMEKSMMFNNEPTLHQVRFSNKVSI